jgi:hypothetical protein
MSPEESARKLLAIIKHETGQQGNIEHIRPITFLFQSQEIERKVPNPCAFSPAATAILRGLKRLEPLPCANAMTALALRGYRNVPANLTGGMRTS